LRGFRRAAPFELVLVARFADALAGGLFAGVLLASPAGAGLALVCGGAAGALADSEEDVPPDDED
jgi:hypothetical protein